MKPFKRSDAPDSPYYVKFTVKGRQVLWCTGATEAKIAVLRGKDHRRNVIAGVHTKTPGARSVEPTFDELFKHYETLPLSVSHTSRKRNMAAMRRVIEAEGIDSRARIDCLTAKLVLTHQKRLQDQGASPATINSRFRFARSLFSRPALVGYKAMGMPVRADIVTEFFSVAYLRVPETRPEIPTADQITSAREALKPFMAERRGFLLAAYAGLRSKEIMAAQWDWIEDGTLYVGGRDFVAKSQKWRAVKLDPAILAMLEEGKTPTEPAMSAICGPNASTAITRRLPGLLKAFGYTSPDPVHSLRRYFGSRVASVSGLWAAKSALGHASYSTTERSYARQMELAAAIGVS